MDPLDVVRWDERGLAPVVVQDADTGEVLTLAWANRAALAATLQTGQAHFWSRSRQTLWRKGATSGHTQHVVEVRLDCDGDALLYRVRPAGPACHTGARSCFARAWSGEAWRENGPDPRPLPWRLDARLAERAAEASAASYTARLLAAGVDRIARKLGEECAETIVAAKNDDPAELRAEAADLVYHLLVLLRARGLAWADVATELAERERA